MMFEHVKLERRGPITIVTINRPEVLNALHMPANEELSRVFDDLDDEPGASFDDE